MFSIPLETSQNSFQSPKGFSVAIWKLRDICENMRKPDVLPEESASLKVVPAFKIWREEEARCHRAVSLVSFQGGRNN